MHTWDIFEEPPEEFLGYFDVVHVRLITVVVENNNPRPVLANLTKMLSMCNLVSISCTHSKLTLLTGPGGYLQWDEVDTIGCSIKTVPGVTAGNLDELFTQLKGGDT